MYVDEVLQSGSIDKEEFEQRVPDLRVDLINAQYDLTQADFSVIIIVAGDDRVGANALIDRLNEWMDARYIDTNVFLTASEEELQRPRFWRYWRLLPAHGRTALFGGAWPIHALADRIIGKLGKKAFAKRLQQINKFESDLVDDGTLLIKLWLHLPRKGLKKRLKLAQKDPNRAWWVEEQDWEVFERFDEITTPLNELLERTHTEQAPWHVIDSSDERFRDLAVADILLDALQARHAQQLPVPAVESTGAAYPDALGAVDLDQRLEKKDYKAQLEQYQRKYHRLMRAAYEKGLSTVLAFEGWDAGGKGGAIRRLTNAVPARSYKVIPIAAPTSEEKARHYLWRFWRQLPPAGQTVIFDRTWYGRVTVERIEGFATPAQWQRAYEEINDFEEQITDHGIVLLKFWLHISAEEQLARFKAREVTPYKKHKITEEDYRNREKWDDYVLAVNEMVARTDKPDAPWHLVPANDKRFARIYVLKAVCKALEKALGK